MADPAPAAPVKADLLAAAWEFITTKSVQRRGAVGAGIVVPFLAGLAKQKWGIEVPENVLMGMEGLLSAFILQSGWKDAKLQHAEMLGQEAAATVKTSGDAVAALNEVAKP